MSTKTSGYSLRLRSRGNANNSADNDAAGSRTALVSDLQINEGNVPLQLQPIFLLRLIDSTISFLVLLLISLTAIPTQLLLMDTG